MMIRSKHQFPLPGGEGVIKIGDNPNVTLFPFQVKTVQELAKAGYLEAFEDDGSPASAFPSPVARPAAAPPAPISDVVVCVPEKNPYDDATSETVRADHVALCGEPSPTAKAKKRRRRTRRPVVPSATPPSAPPDEPDAHDAHDASE